MRSDLPAHELRVRGEQALRHAEKEAAQALLDGHCHLAESIRIEGIAFPTNEKKRDSENELKS